MELGAIGKLEGEGNGTNIVCAEIVSKSFEIFGI